MKFLRDLMDKQKPLFEKGGKLESLYYAFEAGETFLFSPNHTTGIKGAQVKDAIDLKRMMITVVVAMIPCLLFGIYNVGHQSLLATGETAGLWENFGDKALIGLQLVLPIIIVAYAAGGLVEATFAVIRKHPINEGFLVTGMLIPLVVPATTPLWQVALGIAFGVVVGKEVFGGTGKNFLNPALTGRAFLYFAYPAYMSGDSIWTPVDGYSGATSLGIAAAEGYESLSNYGITWADAFLGTIQGSLGETSTLACAIGLVFLLMTKIANYRMVVGCLAGMIVFSSFLNWIGSDTNPMFSMPWYWHLVIGSYAFGLVFMVTEPVSGSHTNLGRYIYGALIGFMVVMIRVLNPAFPEGMMLAILFGNIFAPLIDHFVVMANIKRRAKFSV